MLIHEAFSHAYDLHHFHNNATNRTDCKLCGPAIFRMWVPHEAGALMTAKCQHTPTSHRPSLASTLQKPILCWIIISIFKIITLPSIYPGSTNSIIRCYKNTRMHIHKCCCTVHHPSLFKRELPELIPPSRDVYLCCPPPMLDVPSEVTTAKGYCCRTNSTLAEITDGLVVRAGVSVTWTVTVMICMEVMSSNQKITKLEPKTNTWAKNTFTEIT